MIAPRQALARNRALWSVINAEFTDAEADARWAAAGIEWGLFRTREEDLGLVGDVCGLDVAELGCGTAFLSAALARAGGRPVGVDLNGQQLATARRCQVRFGPAFPLIEADGHQVPLRSASFDLVVSEYGVSPWCEPTVWLTEAARILRPGGRLVFLTSSVLAALCVPAAGGPTGDRLLRSLSDVAHVAWPGGGVEHHPSHGDWIRELRVAGFEIEALHELHAPPGATCAEYYGITSAEWAGRWPVEEVWVARRSG